MPYRKKLYRKKRTFKRKTSAKTVTKIAKAVVLRMTNKKSFDITDDIVLSGYSSNLTALPTFWEPTNINLNTTLSGQPDSARTGSKVMITKIQAGFQFNPAAGNPNAYARIMLVRFPRNSTNTITPANILEWSTSITSAMLSLPQNDTELTYQILCDRRVSFGVQDTNRIGGTHSAMQFINLNYSKAPLKVQYSDPVTSGGFVAIESGYMAWFCFCNDSSATLRFTERVEFYEN